MSFRLGMLVDKMGKRIEAPSHVRYRGDIVENIAELPSWTVLIAGSDAEEAVKIFANESNVSMKVALQLNFAYQQHPSGVRAR